MVCPAFTKSKVFRISAALVLLAIIGGMAYGFYLFNLKHTDLSKVKPAFTLSAAELYSAFENDETAATAKYTGKVVEVNGNVAAFEYGTSDSTINITLRENEDLSGVIATFSGITDKSQVVAKPGDKIIIRGECSGMLMDVLLNNCVVVGGK